MAEPTPSQESYQPKRPTPPPKKWFLIAAHLSGYFLPITNLFQIFKERFKVFCFVVVNLAKTKYLVNGLFSKI